MWAGDAARSTSPSLNPPPSRAVDRPLPLDFSPPPAPLLRKAGTGGFGREGKSGGGVQLPFPLPPPNQAWCREPYTMVHRGKGCRV